MAVDEEGRVLTFKLPSTPHAPEKAVLEGLSKVAKFGEVLHASTIGTNALLGQVGA